jgi:hypothetical protein
VPGGYGHRGAIEDCPPFDTEREIVDVQHGRMPIADIAPRVIDDKGVRALAGEASSFHDVAAIIGTGDPAERSAKFVSLQQA